MLPLGLYGTTVVGYYTDATGHHGFIYNGSAFTSLNDPSADQNVGVTYAAGVYGGLVVGNYETATASHAYIYYCKRRRMSGWRFYFASAGRGHRPPTTQQHREQTA